MDDTDIIKQTLQNAERPNDYISLKTIVDTIPNMDFENPTTYFLYKFYNQKLLTDEEMRNVELTIEKLKHKKCKENNKNIEYMEKNGSNPLEFKAQPTDFADLIERTE